MTNAFTRSRKAERVPQELITNGIMVATHQIGGKQQGRSQCDDNCGLKIQIG
ncbi:hypothetical protein [Nitrosomonas aestuarii]|uniref:hypothetical protein n=1 Tax=Nitrosomonas aestuarii TaxID=52441 RepID=UPI00147A1D2D|nr:hypothetical protein [Nitrosomonas aestuarii]